jgi:Na+/H+ antiporter NhaD/arsenite permease-like protein
MSIAAVMEYRLGLFELPELLDYDSALGAWFCSPRRHLDGRAAILSWASRYAEFGKVRLALPQVITFCSRLPRVLPKRLPRAILFVSLVSVAVIVFTYGLRAGVLSDHHQVVSLSIFCGVMLGILLYEEHRLLVCSIAVAATLGFGLFSSVHQFVAAAGLDVILFLLGTFLVAGYLEQNLFFEHLASQIVRHVGRRPAMLMGVLMFSAMIASAIVGEVAAILFVGGAMLHIAQRYRLKPIPFLIMLVFATNIGSAASAFGPVGVTIAFKAKLTVLDFFRWATPIAVAVLGLVFLICRWSFAWDWAALALAVHQQDFGSSVPDPSRRRSQAPGWILVGIMTGLFVLHAQIEQMLGLGSNSVLLIAATGAGAVALLLSGSGAKEVIQNRVDWETLAFFLALFVVVGALQATGVTTVIARQLMRGSGGHPAALVLEVGWSTGFLSAFLANILAVAAFIPIVADLKAHGAVCPTAIYWLMLFGATFMGNMTSIGSTCNIIACGMIDKRGHGTIYFRSWLKVGVIISLSSMALATLLLAAQTHGLRR